MDACLTICVECGLTKLDIRVGATPITSRLSANGELGTPTWLLCVRRLLRSVNSSLSARVLPKNRHDLLNLIFALKVVRTAQLADGGTHRRPGNSLHQSRPLVGHSLALRCVGVFAELSRGSLGRAVLVQQVLMKIAPQKISQRRKFGGRNLRSLGVIGMLVAHQRHSG